MRKPLIGVTPLYDYNYNSWWIIPGYLDAVIAAGGAPVMLPFTDDEDVVKEHIERLDGIIFTGGPDSDPALYGEKPRQYCTNTRCDRKHLFQICLR